MKGSPNANLRYVQHPLNISKTKSSFSFRKSERFVQDKSYSPNKFYALPSTLSHRTSTIGFGNKTNFEKSNFIEPTRYRVSSDFDKGDSRTPKFTTFGISRQDYYKGKSSGNKVGPGTYQITQKQKNSGGYMGSRYEPPAQKHTVSAFTYDIKGAMGNLSTFKNSSKGCRMKTEYYPKPKFHQNDTRTPGPGSYYQQAPSNNSITKSRPYLFGKEQRIKKDKTCKTGPGSYNLFSQFGFQ